MCKYLSLETLDRLTIPPQKAATILLSSLAPKEIHYSGHVFSGRASILGTNHGCILYFNRTAEDPVSLQIVNLGDLEFLAGVAKETKKERLEFLNHLMAILSERNLRSDIDPAPNQKIRRVIMAGRGVFKISP